MWSSRLSLIFSAVLFGSQSPDFAELSARAQAARTADHLPEAIVLYGKALELRPDWTEGWWGLATAEYDQNSYREAAGAFAKVASLDAKAGSARVLLGLCEFELGQDDAALHHIQEGESIGVANDPHLRHVALYHEGLLLERAGKFEGAEQALNSLCLAGVDDTDLDLTLGKVALRVRDTTDPAVIAQVGQAECLGAQKKFDEAEQRFRALVTEHPNFPRIHYAYGRLLLEARKSQAGIAELEQEIKQHPNDATAHLEIASAKYKIDSLAGVPYAEQAVKLDPALPFAHYLLGLLLLDTDNYARAIPELEIAQRGMPQTPAVYSALASAYARAGRPTDAAKARQDFAHYTKP